MKRTNYLQIAAGLLIGGLSLQLSASEYAIHADGSIGTFYDPGYDDPYGNVNIDASSSMYLASSWGHGSAVPGTWSASFLTDKTFQISFFAPEGLRYEVAPPPGAFRTDFHFAMSTAPGPRSPFYENSTLVSGEFLGGSGTVPVLLPEIELSAGRDGVNTLRSDVYGSVTESFSFTGFTATFDLDPTFSYEYVDHSLNFVFVSFIAKFAADTAEPEQWVTATIVPEPSTGGFALMAFAVLGLRLFRRRS